MTFPILWTHDMAPDLESLTACMGSCGTFLAMHNVPEEAIFAAHLVLEELASNTIKYGHRDCPPAKIQARLELFADRFLLTMEDGSHAFDPFDQPPPDLDLPAEKRPIGGLGLHLVKNLVNSFQYSREGNRNIVRVEKHWETPQAS